MSAFPLVVETVIARTMRELRDLRDQAAGDMVELRLDHVRDIDVAGALEGRQKPVIVTCRASWEGGAFDGDEATRLGALQQAIDLGAEYVDIEWRADRRRITSRAGTRIVLSHHDFSCTPGDLPDRIAAMASERPDVLKIAVQAHRLADCVLLRDETALDLPHVAIAMGPAGHLSRLAPHTFGSLWTYGGAAAPGQVPTRDLIDVYRVGSRSATSGLYGVAGAPLAHSASPAMHNAAFGSLGLDAVYVPFETADASDLLAAGEAFDVSGLSVTAPLKTDVFARLDDRDDLGTRTGAINTLRRSAGGWAGRNFDVAGFLAPLDRHGMDLRGCRAVVLGAGGAARTALWALRERAADVEVAARRVDRAERLAGEFGARAAAWPPRPGWDLLVNATTVGTWPDVDATPIDPDVVRGRLVYDLVYNPEATALLRAAREHGAEVIGGLEMLVEQACLQFEWWTGQTGPRDVMRTAARQFLESRQGDQ